MVFRTSTYFFLAGALAAGTYALSAPAQMPEPEGRTDWKHVVPGHNRRKARRRQIEQSRSRTREEVKPRSEVSEPSRSDSYPQRDRSSQPSRGRSMQRGDSPADFGQAEAFDVPYDEVMSYDRPEHAYRAEEFARADGYAEARAYSRPADAFWTDNNNGRDGWGPPDDHYQANGHRRPSMYDQVEEYEYEEVYEEALPRRRGRAEEYYQAYHDDRGVAESPMLQTRQDYRSV